MAIYTAEWATAQTRVLSFGQHLGTELAGHFQRAVDDLEQVFRGILRERNGIIAELTTALEMDRAACWRGQRRMGYCADIRRSEESTQRPVPGVSQAKEAPPGP